MRRKLLTALIGSMLYVSSALPAFADYAAGVVAYAAGNYEKAAREFKSDETAGSYFILSQMYGSGIGLNQDKKTALTYLHRAAELGLDVAQADLGLLYLEGAGVHANEAEGLRWLRKAAAQGLPEAETIVRAFTQVEVASR
ncbi:sel1 repeat family protein [Geomonas nitrogeniifigens]|uniref:Sel1 repeat family protein n=1 Tax=Geomonas diazotrophica TaxID=2843197 RepID=A0ABX8JIM8_9BACT|nr:tetratricopeptide repeat protein [Geomonas nitrogeniifigens]QWV96489.1 sel1 repeat family protein [Geomonas nitrogeniifigens]QXE85595.1 sel1 repeat family protein [Geomonas nitrogeniifigens]